MRSTSSPAGSPPPTASGTTAERLLHGSACPVAVAPAGLPDGWTPRTIGVGFIDLDEGRNALAAAAALARLSDASLEAVTAIRPLQFGDGAAVEPYHTRAGSEAARDAAD